MQHEQTIEFGQQALMTTLTLIADPHRSHTCRATCGSHSGDDSSSDQTISYIPNSFAFWSALLLTTLDA